MNNKIALIAFTLTCTVFSCKSDKEKIKATKQTENIISKEKAKVVSLPYDEIKNLSEFNNPGANWVEVGGLTADYDSIHHFNITKGKGIILNTNNKPKKHLFTNLKHRDIELDLEFMMPKKSNSGIYFQGRYEIQLLDSWGVKKPKHSDCGGVYQRWDKSRPEGQKGYGGVPPKINASKAPGIWQHYNIIFKAPRFDKDGNKIANARFEKVTHNGFVIHENIEVTGPTRAAFFNTETEDLAPIMIQGDHGPVAFRNIKYKLYNKEASISNLSYEYYEADYRSTTDIKKEDFVKPGKASGFYIDSITPKKTFALKFNGNLNIPKTGDYIFHQKSMWGARVFIDDSLVIKNDQYYQFKLLSKKINLKEGVHNIKVNYFSRWNPKFFIEIEGPNVQRKPLASYPLSNENKISPLMISATEKPRVQRGFVMYNGKKKTNTISVGFPSKLNYTFNANNGSIIQFWKGEFGDAKGMWKARGGSQLFSPLGVLIKGIDYPSIKRLNKNKEWKDCKSITFTFNGYKLNNDKAPVFLYKQEEMFIEDLIIPNAKKNGFTRTLSVLNPMKDTWFNVVTSNEITEIKENLYSIDNKYYIKIPKNSDFKIRSINDKKELLLSTSKKINYSIIW